MAMPKLKLNTGADIPGIGFGTWRLSPSEARESVAAALDIGYRLIDTAKLYANEKEVGQAIRASGIPREQIYVTTKLWTSDQAYESTRQAFEESRRKLNLEYIDLYLIHWPGDDRHKRHEAWRAMAEIHQAGTAKAIGVSNFTIDNLKELMEASDIKPAVNQIQFHPFIYSPQKELLDYCQAEGIVFEAYSPLARGRLSDPMLAEIGRKYGKSPSQVTLRWAIQHGTIPLPRSSQRKHIEENFDVFDFELLGEDMAAIDRLG